MKLLYLITRAEYGGAQTHLLELLEGFRSSFEIHLAAGEEGFLTGEARRLELAVHILSNLIQPLHFTKDVQALRETLSLIRLLRPTLVHAHSSKAGFLGRLAARAAGVPAIFTAHGWAFANGVPPGRKLLATCSEWSVSRLGYKIVTVSGADRALALRYGIARPEQVHVIRNGIKELPSIQRERTWSGRDNVRLVMVGRFASQKDHSLLLQAIAAIDAPLSVGLIGDGPSRCSVQALAEELGLRDSVVFLGLRDDVPNILARANIFTLISKWEGFPISILEAMRAGLPVVASDVGGVSEAVVDGETGFLVPRGDVAALRQRLQQLIVDPELRERMGKAGRQRFEALFTVDRMLEQTLHVYEEVLGEHFASTTHERSYYNK